jgi:putative lipoprotein
MTIPSRQAFVTRPRLPASLGLIVLLLLLATPRKTLAADSPAGMITGTVSYLQRMALPPDALITVSLLDVTAADGPARLIVEQRFPAAGRQVPIPFRLPYDAASIDSSHRYSLRATITNHGRLSFTTTSAYPVLTGSSGRTAELVLQAVSGTAKPAAAAGTRPSGPATLENTHWKLLELGGAAVVAGDNKREPHLIFRAAQHHVAGTSGCNRLFGSYEAGADQSLKMKMGGMTMMACAEPLMTQEKNLLDALAAVTNYRIDGEKLELRKGDQVLVRFEARGRK